MESLINILGHCNAQLFTSSLKYIKKQSELIEILQAMLETDTTSKYLGRFSFHLKSLGLNLHQLAIKSLTIDTRFIDKLIVDNVLIADSDIDIYYDLFSNSQLIQIELKCFKTKAIDYMVKKYPLVFLFTNSILTVTNKSLFVQEISNHLIRDISKLVMEYI